MIYVARVALVIAKLLSNRKSLQVFFQKTVRFQVQLIFSGSSCNSQIHSNEHTLSSGLIRFLLGSIMCLASDKHNSLGRPLMKMQSYMKLRPGSSVVLKERSYIWKLQRDSNSH